MFFPAFQNFTSWIFQELIRIKFQILNHSTHSIQNCQSILVWTRRTCPFLEWKILKSVKPGTWFESITRCNSRSNIPSQLALSTYMLCNCFSQRIWTQSKYGELWNYRFGTNFGFDCNDGGNCKAIFNWLDSVGLHQCYDKYVICYHQLVSVAS